MFLSDFLLQFKEFFYSMIDYVALAVCIYTVLKIDYRCDRGLDNNESLYTRLVKITEVNTLVIRSDDMTIIKYFVLFIAILLQAIF